MTISENVLHRTIIQEINSLFDELVEDENVVDNLDIPMGNKEELDAMKRLINSLTDKLNKTNERLRQVYFDKLDGEISKDEYNTLKQTFMERLTWNWRNLLYH